MSVIVIMTVTGDTETFRASLDDREKEYVALAEEGRAAGALHHRFGIVDERTVVIVDEWETAEAFQAFMARPELQQFMADAGADPSMQPAVAIAEAIPSPDEF